MSDLNRFNWIARSYDGLVRLMFGDTLNRAQMHFVDEIKSTDKVLILGGGSGKFLKTLMTVNPSIHVTYIDASSRMITLAKSQVATHHNIAFVHGTEDDIPETPFDVVITNFLLDLFSQEEADVLVKKIITSLRVNGKWLVTDFEKSPKLTHRVLLRAMYLFFRKTGSIDARGLPDWRSIFGNEGLKLKKEKFFRSGFVSASVFIR